MNSNNNLSLMTPIKLFILLTGLSFLQISNAQSPIIEWQNTIGGTLGDFNQKILTTLDGGYLLVNQSYSNISGDKSENELGAGDFWLVKLNALGAIEWENTIGGTSDDFCFDAKQLPDGSFVVGGRSSSNISADKSENRLGLSTTSDAWIIKLDAFGNKIWDNTIGGNQSDNIKSIALTEDGGFMLLGNSSSGISIDKTTPAYGLGDIWLVKLDSNGTVLWDKSFGGAGLDFGTQIISTADGGYIIASSSDTGISDSKFVPNVGGTDYWIIKIDANGNQIWQQVYGGTSEDNLINIIQTNDNGYILAGRSHSPASGVKSENNFGVGGDDFWIVKIDSVGGLQWENTIGGTSYESISSVHQNVMGEYLVVGSSTSLISGDKTEDIIGPYEVFSDNWILKLDILGNIIWQKVIGGNENDYTVSSVLNDDGSLVVAGYSYSPATDYKNENPIGLSDIWVYKMYADICPLHVAVTPTSDTTFCKPGSVTLTTQYDATLTYQWRRNGSNIAGATTNIYTANKTGNYTVKISNGICTKVAQEVQVTANPKPVVTINNLDGTNNLCVDASIKLKTSNGPGYTFQWYLDDVPIVGANTNIYNATTIGNYKVNVTNASGCFNTSAGYNIINACKLEQFTQVTIYPNPFTDAIAIVIPENEVKIDNFILTDITGKIVYTNKISKSNETFYLTFLPTGLYFIRFYSADKFLFVQTIIKN